jgi:hypothetical protein
MSVAGSMWFPKYRTKVMGAIQAEAQRGVKRIVMVAIKGGPVSQLEHRTMPYVITGAVKDLQKKGVSISLLDDKEETDIKLCLRIMEYDEFLSQFYDAVPLSVSGMCVVAAAKMTQEDLVCMKPGAVMQLETLGDNPAARVKLPEDDAVALLLLIASQYPDGFQADAVLSMHEVLAAEFSDRNSVAVLRKYHYGDTSLSDEAVLRLARAGKTWKDLTTRYGPQDVIELELSDEDSLAVLRKYHYDDTLSDEGVLIAARAGQTQEYLTSVGDAFSALGLNDSDSVVMLRLHKYADLPTLSDEGVLIVAKAGVSQEKLFALGAAQAVLDANPAYAVQLAFDSASRKLHATHSAFKKAREASLAALQEQEAALVEVLAAENEAKMVCTLAVNALAELGLSEEDTQVVLKSKGDRQLGLEAHWVPFFAERNGSRNSVQLKTQRRLISERQAEV